MKLKLTALSLLLLSCTANAHNVWLEPVKEQADRYVVKFGHEETESYPEHKLKSIQALSPKGQFTDIQPQFNAGEAYFSAPETSIVFLQFDNGVWSKLPNGRYAEKTKQQEPTAEFSVNPLKMGKGILQWNDEALKAHNQPYELVPQTKPQAGKPLQILVLHNGKPVEGIKVGVGEDHPFNLTNAQGIAEFTPTQGYNKVWAEFEEAVKTTDYDSRSIEYMLTFDVK
ncbi:nickel transport protein [Cricetibacter osteomyelitidis]|uniref:Nickel transport protein n=1 Tax=Cricetibacter osteomyelitidis TaxID=1521931 RepID=A0A4R2T7P3_9PAST|nr:DUF4198 domain-containing protein [Cricetibacter osteomyelitidis]TCP97711.1 nickel transport protein [Cricetibacter osteomyelitidis]